MTRFTNALDPTTRTEQVEIDVPNSDYHLQPGMYADVTLMTSSKPDALTVPVEAVQRTGDKTYVLAVNSQNQVERREIHTGIQGSNKVEVLAGLAGRRAGDCGQSRKLPVRRDGATARYQLRQPAEGYASNPCQDSQSNIRSSS